MALHTEPEGGCLTGAKTHHLVKRIISFSRLTSDKHLLIFQSELLPGHVQVGLGHQPAERHPDLQVQLLPSVHAHCRIFIRPACRIMIYHNAMCTTRALPCKIVVSHDQLVRSKSREFSSVYVVIVDPFIAQGDDLDII